MSPNEQSPAQAITANASALNDIGPTVSVISKPGKLLRLTQVEGRTALKKSSIYAGVKSCTFPAPVRLAVRAVAWREEDIDRWICERVKVGGTK